MTKRTSKCEVASILVQAQQRERLALDALAHLLYTELAPMIANVSRVAGADSDDVRHDTFLNIAGARTRFDPSRGCPFAYLKGRALSAADYRGAKRAVARASDVDVDELPTELVNSLLEVREQLEIARKIDESLFEVVRLVECDGLTAKDSGALIGLSPSATCRALQDYATRCRAVVQAESALAA
jgi:DNA-directed RNA polymerase specialized sigma24 family protein